MEDFKFDEFGKNTENERPTKSIKGNRGWDYFDEEGYSKIGKADYEQ